jgi:hypothetical protein
MTFSPISFRSSKTKYGVALHRFTLSEFRRLHDCGALGPTDPVELVNGLLAVKTNAIPPYDVPIGIPPEILWEGQRLLDRRPLRKLTAREFDRLVQAGAIEGSVRFELAEGWVVDKMVRNPKHDSTLQRVTAALMKVLPANLQLRAQLAIALDESKYEPDFAVVPGPLDRYDDRHPTSAEVLVVIEVASATLRFDRGVKLRSYARNSIETYWLINVVKNCVEVYTGASGPTDEPGYSTCKKYVRCQSITLFQGTRKILTIAVNDLLRG